jgi:AP endonuclease 1
VQNIPLILETPSFELPQETWMKEIEVLNKLSGLDLSQTSEDTLAEWVKEIKDGVLAAEKVSGKGKKSIAKGTKKRKKDASASEDSCEDD